MNKVTPNHLLTTDELVGMKINEGSVHIPGEITIEEIEAIIVREGWRFTRIIGPNDVVTMDFRLDRVNIHHDENNIIISTGSG